MTTEYKVHSSTQDAVVWWHRTCDQDAIPLSGNDHEQVVYGNVSVIKQYNLVLVQDVLITR